ncbi:ABC transporter ATP-binding protein [Sphingomicrobium sp. XHP0239]|uniref:ABC transporter ATP-binding protein n=1 Tax=Sphingomicrobium maritimum TaxID=3133972 RepID=UPI0031CCB121
MRIEHIRPLLGDMRKRFGRRIFIYIGFQTVSALVEGIGILLLLPLLAALSGEGPDWLPAFASIEVVVIAFLCVMVVRAILLLVRGRMQAAFYRDYSVSLSGELAEALARIGWPAASDIGQARMQQYWNANVPRTTLAVTQLLMMAVSVLLLTVKAAIAFALAPAMAAAATILLALSSLASWTWVRRSGRKGQEALDALSDAREHGFQFHASLKSALAEGREQGFVDRFKALVGAEYGGFYAIERAEAEADVANQFAAAVGLAAILYVGIVAIEVETSVFFLLLILFARMVGPARALIAQLQRFLAYAGSFLPLAALLDSETRVGTRFCAESDDDRLEWQRLEARGLLLPARGEPLGPVDCVVQRGRWVALQGASGTGKSLLVDVVAGLLRPVDGTMTLNDAPFDPSDAPRWPREIAYLGQDGTLLGNTARAMIDPPADATDAEVARLIEMVGAMPLIERLGSLDTRLGDRAARISGGERQRLAVVRAILRRPSLLILDEATAALDLESEAALITAIRSELPDAAVLMVSHRPQTWDLMDDRVALG